MPKACELKPKNFCIFRCSPSSDPPKSPLRRGTLREYSSPLSRGVRGDLDFETNKRYARFDIKLTRLEPCRVPTDLTDSRNDRKTQNCDKHNQGIKLSATALKVFQTFAANQGDKTCQVDYTIDDPQIHFHDLPR